MWNRVVTFFRNIDWINLQNLAVIGIVGLLFDIFWMQWFLLFALLSFVRLIQQAQDAERELDQQSVNNFYRTFFLSQLNPFVLWGTLQQQFGQLVIWVRHLGRLPSPKHFASQITYQLPFRGDWRVASGGITRADSHSWDILTQRYAYDFFIEDEAGKTYRGKGDRLNDYYCYGAAILAPADGQVVRVRDNVRDYPGVGDYTLDWKTRDFRGNFIIIRHAFQEYSFLAHLQPGSLLVRAGDRVKQGQPIGRCGNSGHSTEPHLHFHLQNRANMWVAAGLPVGFHQIKVIENRITTLQDKAFPAKGQQVGNQK